MEQEAEQSQKYEYRISALDESKRMRGDLKMYNIKSGEMCSLPFTAGMARKYAVIYLFTCYFAEQGKLAWVNQLLRVMGWDGSADLAARRRCQMALRRQIVDLKRDFNFEVAAVNGRELPEHDGSRYYKVVSFGIFNEDKLLELLRANREIFIRIIEEGMKR